MYQVEWLDDACEELTEIWQTAESAIRAEITWATQRVDERRRLAPALFGESRPPHGVRVGFVLPLAVEYRIERFPNAVTVLHVWLVRKRQGR